MRACALRTAIARAAGGRVSGSGLPLCSEKDARAPANALGLPANALGLNDNIASRNGPR